MSKQVQIKKTDVPEGWSYDAADLINKVYNNTYYLFSYCKENRLIDLDLEGLVKLKIIAGLIITLGRIYMRKR
jgi:hypothetical protein